MELRTHTITLRGERLILRPLLESDWDTLLHWNNDPDVLYYAEGDDITSYALKDMQQVYQTVSHNAFCFITEYDSMPIGECWLQRMNLRHVLDRYPDLDCRRIDLMIGEKALWGKGLGTEIIRLLTEFAFIQERADKVFGCDVADYNRRSIKAFQKVGYQIDEKRPMPIGSKAQYCFDLVMSKECFSSVK
jgi:RimJ/RimL family protein N-acetyltransferase